MTMHTTINIAARTPKVSIIVPVYKVEAYLPRCLESILSQRFTDFELLLIDDGSPDACGRICDEYALKDERIRTFHQKNAGVSVARNLGLDNARGEWLAFVDSDDWVEEGWLDVFADDTGIRDSDLLLYGRRKTDGAMVFYEYLPPQSKWKARDYINTNEFNMVAVWSCFFRRVIIEKSGIRFSPSLKFAEDTEFLLKTFASSDNILALHAVLYNYYFRKSSATNLTKFDFARASQDIESINGFLSYCAKSGISNERFAPSVRRSYRIFLRNYLRVSNPKPADKAPFLVLYRETIARHPVFRRNLTFQAISRAWMPSLLLARALMRLNHAMKAGGDR